MIDWQEGDVLTNGMRMHYYRTGGHGKPQLVLAHGFSDSGLCWTPVARVLEADYDIIMIDARNHGLSEAPLPSNTGSQGDDLAGLIMALGLDKPAVMGHSMGGIAALMAAAYHPELISKVILEDSGPFDTPNRPPETPESRQQRVDEFKAMQAKGREGIIALGHEQSPAWSAEELGPWADSKLQLRMDAITRSNMSTSTWREAFPLIQCPLLIIRSDRDKGSMILRNPPPRPRR
jgi:pimeloyl-ACP methyl ester carboxylesterase